MGRYDQIIAPYQRQDNPLVEVLPNDDLTRACWRWELDDSGQAVQFSRYWPMIAQRNGVLDPFQRATDAGMPALRPPRDLSWRFASGSEITLPLLPLEVIELRNEELNVHGELIAWGARFVADTPRFTDRFAQLTITRREDSLTVRREDNGFAPLELTRLGYRVVMTPFVARAMPVPKIGEVLAGRRLDVGVLPVRGAL